MIVVVDYGMGNLGSISNMLKKIGVAAVVTSDFPTIEQATKLILPGVGAFDNGMENLHELGLVPVLSQKVLIEKTPMLGICLGMQLLTRYSEEGQRSGLGWIAADTKRFRFEPDATALKVPHMGWNTVRIAKDTCLWTDVSDEPRFYFVHSYHVVCEQESDVLLRTSYGYEFASGFSRDNIAGVQFHPEKSHRFGMQLLKNFAEAC